MSFELWGLGTGFQLDFPARIVGFSILAIYVLALLAVLYLQRQAEHFFDDLRLKRQRNLLLILLLSQFVLAQVLLLRLELPGFRITSAELPVSTVISSALFSAIPWMIAGGILGVRHAVVIALLGGLVLAGRESQGLISVFNFAIIAAFSTWTLRNNFDDLLGRALRNPLINGILAGLLQGFLKTVELFSQYQGDPLIGINYLLGKLGGIIVLSVIPLLVGGLAALAIQTRLRQSWYKPRWLAPGPYKRSLAGRILSLFLILGIFSSSILLVGDWFLAQTSAEELIETQVRQSALDAASGIPYFFQSGRSLVRNYASEVGGLLGDSEKLGARLQHQRRIIEFFDQVAVYDAQTSIVLRDPETEIQVSGIDELELSLEVALSGFPDEVVLAPKIKGESAHLVFLAPIFSPSDGTLVGAYAGWTDLDQNPFLLPTITRLEEFSLGSGYVTDAKGRIIIHPDPSLIMHLSEVDTTNGAGVHSGLGRDGQPQLYYVHPVEGVSWNIVLTVPQVAISSLALRLGLRLIAVILVIGGVVLGVIYAVGRRLIQPLEHMVEVAESIARGNLDKAVPNGGEDEIGRLSVSFERMRSSLQSRLNEMDLLLAVSQRVASSLNLNEVLPPILDGMRGLTRANLVRLLVAPDRPRILTPVEAYESGTDLGGWTSLDKQILELSQQKGHFVLENPTRAQAVFNLAQLTVGINSLAAFPILNEDQFVGCIWLAHQRPHAYSESETNLISIIASNLGVAVANARLYHSGEDERKRLGAMLEAIPDAVIVINAHGVISLANPAAQVILNLPVDEAVGRSVTEVISVDEIQEILEQPVLASRTREVHLADGQVFFVSVSEIQEGVTPSSGRICVLWDISHFKKLDTLKSEFVSTVSHDLKMPLTMMKGYVTMLSMVGSMNDQQKEYLRKITESSEQMERLVDNLLDLGRIEAGLGLKLEQIEVNSIIFEVVDSFKPQAANRQISLESEVEANMAPVELDPTLFRQALANLLDNAINFTPSGGGVVVRAGQSGGKLRISVEDTGVGISPTDQARLFEKFYRVHKEETGDRAGSGLGLAIVKSIVEQHDGRIFVESRLGMGSTFTINLPLRGGSVR